MGSASYSSVNPVERVRELTWALVDEHIEDAEWRELEALLTESADARLAYIEAMQLHTDLLFHFKERAPDGDKSQTPVLGFLGGAGAMPASTMEMGS